MRFATACRVQGGGRIGPLRRRRQKLYTLPHVTSILRERPRPHRQDVHRPAARRARRDEDTLNWRKPPAPAPRRRSRSSRRTSTRRPTAKAPSARTPACRPSRSRCRSAPTRSGWPAQIREAIAEATRRGKLRPNSVDSITGQELRQQPRARHAGHPLRAVGRDEIEVKLLLKGGGCENCNAQYAVPVELAHLGRADRNLEGVRKCILHAVWQAQGKGCAPGAVGVCIGGDRTSGYAHAKAAAVPHARRRESGSAAGASSKRRSWRR